MAPRKKKKPDTTSSEQKTCIIHFDNCKDEKFTFLTEERLIKIKNIATLRQNQPNGSPEKMDNVCSQIPETCHGNYGYHRTCYVRFTTHLNRLQPQVTGMQKEVASKPKRRNKEEKDDILFLNDCIFCGKRAPMYRKKKGMWSKERLENFQVKSWKHVLKCAEKKSDKNLLLRIRGYDLAACGAKFHRTCSTINTNDPKNWRSDSNEAKKDQIKLEKCHSQAFEAVSKVLQIKFWITSMCSNSLT